MKIFGWLADHAGCGWYRIVLPLSAMREHGHEVRYHRRMDEQDWESDVIVGQRVCLDGPSSRWQRIARSSGARPKLVYELDDNLWAIDSGNHPSVRKLYGNPRVRQNMIENVRVADLVTVSTEPLAEVVRRWNSNVHVLPNCIPEQFLYWRTGRHEDRITIGWQGSPTHDQDWRDAVAPIQRWFSQAKRQHQIEMHTVGQIPGRFPEVHPHRHTPWSDSIPDYYRSMDWHIALGPLANTKFNASKSWLRALEAAMLGFPIVASNVHAYRDFVQHGETGFLVNNPREWADHLQTLVADYQLRARMSRAAWQLAMNHTIEKNVNQWLEAYNQ